MKYLRLSVLIGFVLILYAACTPKMNSGESDESIKYDTLAKEYYANRGEKEELVLKDSKAFESVWTEAYSAMDPMPKLPAIDFSQEMVIAVFMGGKNSGGYEIEITKIKDLTSHIEVTVKNTTPKAGGVVTMSLTSPFHVVKLEKQSKEVKFIVE